ncbi:MAG: hypothetical protein LBO78_01800, partial [Rickettsiales bacterium]|nr:hypothetical protein [Rickettsiales bacterium]
MKMLKILLPAIALFASGVHAETGTAVDADLREATPLRFRVAKSTPYFGVSVGTAMLAQDAEVSGVSYDGEKLDGLAFSLSFGTRYARAETFVGWEIDYMDFDSSGGTRSSRFYGPSVGASIVLFTAV